MMLSIRLPFALMFTALLVGGCAEQQPPDRGPFKGAVTKIVELRNVIRDGFAAGDVDAAHDPLHEVGYELTGLVKLAETSGFSDDQLQIVNTTVDTLMGAFAEVDKTLHGGEGSTYDEESETIDAAVRTIAEIAGVDSVGKPVIRSAAAEERFDDLEEPEVVAPEPEPVAAPEPVDAPEPEA